MPPAQVRAIVGPGFALALFCRELVLVALSLAGLVVFCLPVAFKVFLSFVATRPGFARRPVIDFADKIKLRVCTVLVPLYRKTGAIAVLATALSRPDWPESRLDILLLPEAGDDETEAVVQVASWPAGTRRVEVPMGSPQIKPRALSYRLQYARGTTACIYDAEDRPHPKRLKAAYWAFTAAGDELACVKAPLAACNHRQSWIALHWALESAVRFGLLLPALAKVRLPILLGGTSNHFRGMSVLRSLGGWDAWNVAEDADLGVCLARHGYRSDTIAPLTFEEAPDPRHLDGPALALAEGFPAELGRDDALAGRHDPPDGTF